MGEAMTSDTQARLVSFLKDFEGLKLDPYHDGNGYPTIGYGHKLSNTKYESLDRWPSLTGEEQAHGLLLGDIYGAAQIWVHRLVKVSLDTHQLGALCSFCFNIGATEFGKSTLLRKLNSGETEEASKEFGRWVYIKGEKSNGLIRRREAERSWFTATELPTI